MAVGVVVTPLAVAILIPHEHHWHTMRCQQGGCQVSHLWHGIQMLLRWTTNGGGEVIKACLVYLCCDRSGSAHLQWEGSVEGLAG